MFKQIVLFGMPAKKLRAGMTMRGGATWMNPGVAQYVTDHPAPACLLRLNVDPAYNCSLLPLNHVGDISGPAQCDAAEVFNDKRA
jgi:hypothetical protein